jgi:predicted TIM-barrel fold metal-dependent hydrolase
MAVETVGAARQERSKRVRQQIIDCDVHPVTKDGIGSIAGYLSTEWRKRFEQKGAFTQTSFLTPRFSHPNGYIIRSDAAPPGGGPGGSDPKFVAADLLDRWGIDVAVLNSIQVGGLVSALTGPDESIALAAAFNDYWLSEWCGADERFRVAITVPTQDPIAAAAEVRRLGANPAVSAVALPMINVLVGNRHYHPIYEAAAEHGLPILLHVTGTDYVYQGAPAGMGWPENYVERYVALAQIGISNLGSLVFSGVFERFPGLKFIFVEFGFGWALPALWRMDKAWQALRVETPWVKRFPSEYVRERVRFTTQPLDEPADPKHLYSLIEMLGDEVLCFSTDYPHWDNDPPNLVLQGLDAQARQRVFWQNAASTFRL